MTTLRYRSSEVFVAGTVVFPGVANRSLDTVRPCRSTITRLFEPTRGVVTVTAPSNTVEVVLIVAPW